MLAYRSQISKPIALPPCPVQSGPRESALDEALDLMAAQMHFARGAEIFGEGEPAEYIYRIVSGAACSYQMLDDGRRQIVSFHLPGEYLGFECSGGHRLSAESVADCVVLVIKRATIETLIASDPAIAQALLALATHSLQRAQSYMLLLGRKTAQERLVTFLLDMAERSGATNTVELPMSRQDIADNLGLTIETVSRTFTQLDAIGAIALRGSRCVDIRGGTGLKRLDV